MDLVLKNCKLIDQNQEKYIGIENGKISKISNLPINGEKIVDIKNQIVFPGFIDPHVHFRDPGLTEKEDFKSGSLSAAYGGFTTIIDMPNTNPKTNTYKAYKDKVEIANKKSFVNFYLQAGTNTLEEMKKIVKLNPIAFKIFMDLENDESLDKIFKDLGILKNETQYNGIVCTHCEKKEIVKRESEKLQKKSIKNPIDYSYGRPSKSEDESVKQAIELARKNKLKLHICHLSSKQSLDLVRKNNVSYEFTPHHLLLDNSKYNEFGTLVKTNPPLREEKNKISVKDIDEYSMIGTDHAPHTLEDKNKGVWSSSPGIPNLETVVPLLLTEVNKCNLDLKLIPKIFSENVAKFFGLENKGRIQEGKDADFTVINLKEKGKFDIDSFKTKAKYSPFENQEYIGNATMTIVNGKIIVEK